MAKDTKVSPWAWGVAAGVLLGGTWYLGRKLGTDLARERVENPTLNVSAGRRPNPEEGWAEARTFVVPHDQHESLMAGVYPLPHACNPVDRDTWGGPNRICVSAGDRFVSVNPQTQNRVHAPLPTEVTFSENLQEYAVGQAWYRGVLDRWLHEHGYAPMPIVTPAMLPSWPQDALTAAFIVSPKTVAAAQQFSKVHSVHTPVGPIGMLALPATQGVTSFRRNLLFHVLRFFQTSQA